MFKVIKFVIFVARFAVIVQSPMFKPFVDINGSPASLAENSLLMV